MNTAATPIPLLGESKQALETFLTSMKQPRFRAKQLWQWLHGTRVSSFDAMTNLSKDLRARLTETCTVYQMKELQHLTSSDKLTEKWLLHTDIRNNPEHIVETVLIRELRLTRRTVCLSCMVGCPIGCVFCASGQCGYDRPLTAAEMIEQVYRVDATCRANGEEEDGRAVSHVVFMGMGEPLLNLDAVLTAARTFADPDGLHLSGRHITISTVGVIPGIRRLADENVNFRLAISLHAPTQALREMLIPSCKQWPLDELIPTLKTFAAQTSRAITFEYCLIDKVNAARADAKNLARLIRPLNGKVNLIPLNPTSGFDGRPPSAETIRSFQETLETAGVPATLRTEKGQDINAACGQLRANRKQQS